VPWSLHTSKPLMLLGQRRHGTLTNVWGILSVAIAGLAVSNLSCAFAWSAKQTSFPQHDATYEKLSKSLQLQAVQKPGIVHGRRHQSRFTLAGTVPVALVLATAAALRGLSRSTAMKASSCKGCRVILLAAYEAPSKEALQGGFAKKLQQREHDLHVVSSESTPMLVSSVSLISLASPSTSIAESCTAPLVGLQSSDAKRGKVAALSNLCAARLVGNRRFGEHRHRTSLRATTASSDSSGKASHRSVGARLQAASIQKPTESFDPSRVRTQIQHGLTMSSNSTPMSRDAKTMLTIKGSTEVSGLYILAGNFEASNTKGFWIDNK